MNFKMNPETLRKINIWLDVIGIILLLAAFIYFYMHLPDVRLMLSDPCQVCMNKTGATCFIHNLKP